MQPIKEKGKRGKKIRKSENYGGNLGKQENKGIVLGFKNQHQFLDMGEKINYSLFLFFSSKM